MCQVQHVLGFDMQRISYTTIGGGLQFLPCTFCFPFFALIFAGSSFVSCILYLLYTYPLEGLQVVLSHSTSLHFIVFLFYIFQVQGPYIFNNISTIHNILTEAQGQQIIDKSAHLNTMSRVEIECEVGSRKYSMPSQFHTECVIKMQGISHILLLHIRNGDLHGCKCQCRINTLCSLEL